MKKINKLTALIVLSLALAVPDLYAQKTHIPELLAQCVMAGSEVPEDVKLRAQDLMKKTADSVLRDSVTALVLRKAEKNIIKVKIITTGKNIDYFLSHDSATTEIQYTLYLRSASVRKVVKDGQTVNKYTSSLLASEVNYLDRRYGVSRMYMSRCMNPGGGQHEQSGSRKDIEFFADCMANLIVMSAAVPLSLSNCLAVELEDSTSRNLFIQYICRRGIEISNTDDGMHIAVTRYAPDGKELQYDIRLNGQNLSPIAVRHNPQE